MRPPMYPCKVGIHLKVSIGNEHELYVGHIMDTANPNPEEWQSYELPLNLFHHDMVLSKVLNPQMDDLFITNGINFSVESDKETSGEPIFLDIQSIDIINNPDFDKIKKSYKLPVFFKSDYDLSQGYVDNGRHLVPLNMEEEEEIFGEVDRQKYGKGIRNGPTRKQTQSINERLKL
jgi:hypothetical protein